MSGFVSSTNILSSVISLPEYGSVSLIVNLLFVGSFGGTFEGFCFAFVGICAKLVVWGSEKKELLAPWVTL